MRWRAGWLLAGLMLAGCHRAPAAQGAAATPETAAEDYARRMSAGDPDQCFAATSMHGAAFKRPAGGPAAAVPTRVIIAVDGSGSMAGRIGGTTKLDLAKRAAAAFVDDLPPEVDAGLLLFGAAGDNTPAGKAASCRSVDLVAAPSHDRAALADAMATVRPVGWTPLAAALARAESLLSAGESPGRQVIYVVSDGEETCGGDPVAVARRINRGSTRAVVNIIGFAVPATEAASLSAVAAAGGGRFINSETDGQAEVALALVRENNRRAVNAIAQANGTARNNIAAADAGAQARICTSNLIARERIAVANDLARKRIAGQPVAAEEAGERLMEQRHRALEQRTEAFVARMDAARDAANGGIDAAAANAR